jgi:hypothetical protein
MATIATALDTPFTPAAGDFIVQCSAGTAALERSNDVDAPFVLVGFLTGNDAPIVANPVAGARYQFRQIGSTTAVVQADQ